MSYVMSWLSGENGKEMLIFENDQQKAIRDIYPQKDL